MSAKYDEDDSTRGSRDGAGGKKPARGYSENPFRESMLRLLNTIPAPREDPDDIEIDPPPAIDPQKIADISKIASLAEATELWQDINRNIELHEGLGALALRAQRLEYIKKANEARRCAHMRLDGSRCGSPAMREREYCFYHREIHADHYELPALEDHRSIQLAYMQLYRNVGIGAISLTNAKVLLQILQGAAKNLPETEWAEEYVQED